MYFLSDLSITPIATEKNVGVILRDTRYITLFQEESNVCNWLLIIIVNITILDRFRISSFLLTPFSCLFITYTLNIFSLTKFLFGITKILPQKPKIWKFLLKFVMIIVERNIWIDSS